MPDIFLSGNELDEFVYLTKPLIELFRNSKYNIHRYSKTRLQNEMKISTKDTCCKNKVAELSKT